jgi:hypothetical protein
MYVYSIIDSLILYLGLTRKRRSIDDDAEKKIDTIDKTTKKYFYSNVDKGRKFEKFVLSKFDKNHFSIFRMTSPFQG